MNVGEVHSFITFVGFDSNTIVSRVATNYKFEFEFNRYLAIFEDSEEELENFFLESVDSMSHQYAHLKPYPYQDITSHWKQVYQLLERQRKQVREDTEVLCGLVDGLRERMVVDWIDLVWKL